MIRELTREEALQAAAEGKEVIMLWRMEEGGTLRSSNLTERVMDAANIGKTFVLVEDESLMPDPKLAEPVDNVVTDPDTSPITVEIPNSHREEKERQRKLDDEAIIRMKKDGVSETKIAERLDAPYSAIHYRVGKLKKEGKIK